MKDHIKEIRPIIIWAFLLNTIWEFGQCVFLYDMWDWPFWKATFWMWAAIIGDVFIVLGLWKITEFIFSPVNFKKLKLKDYLYLIFISFIASIVLEWTAKFLELWTYSRLMPVLIIFDYEVGLSPIIQITLLPALSVYFSNAHSVSSITLMIQNVRFIALLISIDLLGIGFSESGQFIQSDSMSIRLPA